MRSAGHAPLSLVGSKRASTSATYTLRDHHWQPAEPYWPLARLSGRRPYVSAVAGSVGEPVQL